MLKNILTILIAVALSVTITVAGPGMLRGFGVALIDTSLPSSGTEGEIRYDNTSTNTLWLWNAVDGFWQGIHRTPWYISGQIGGASTSLGTGPKTTYTTIGATTLTLVVDTDSASVEISCVGVVPEGLDCNTAGVSEQHGIAFTPPWAGKFYVCTEYHHRGDIAASAVIETIFQLIETPLDSNTISQLGGGIQEHGIIADATDGVDSIQGMHLCGLFDFPTDPPTKVQVKLAYEQAVSGTVSASQLLVDRSGTKGQRDNRWWVKPW